MVLPSFDTSSHVTARISERRKLHMIASGKVLGELLFESDPSKREALDVDFIKKNRVIVAQFASKEAIANTPHSPRFMDSMPQSSTSVKHKNDLDADIEQYQPRDYLKNSDATRGVCINDRTQAFTEQILNGEKTIVLNNNRAQNIAAHII